MEVYVLIKLIKKSKVYCPEYMGEMDILIAGGKIVAMGKDLSFWQAKDEVELIDAVGTFAIPGLI